MRNSKRRLPAALLGVVVLGSVLVGGCTRKPQAPALRNDPVYQNDQEGFRFLVPEGWAMVGNSNHPPGPATKNLMLVQYRRRTQDRRGMLEVDMIDLPPSTDVTAYLAGPSFGAKEWRRIGATEPVQSGSLSGERYNFSSRVGGTDDMTKEVVVFRRGERCYLFIGLFPPSDDAARAQIRQAVASTVWKN
jgi:hypothetical protein